MASGKQTWLIVAGIGCGVIVLMVAFAAVIGGVAFNRLRQGVDSAAAAHDAVIAEHGRSDDYRPPADGRIEPQRVEAFLAEGMGHGEYLYLDAFAIREQRLERIRTRVNRRLRPMLRHQLEDARSLPDADAGWIQALAAESAALEADAMHLPG